MIMVHDPGLGVGDSLIGTESDIWEKLGPAAAALFSILAGATPSQLAWPAAIGRTASPGVEPCRSFLKASSLAHALGVARVSDYLTETQGIGAIEEAAERRAGFVRCSVELDSGAREGFVLALDNASVMDRIETSLGTTSALHADTLVGQVAGEKVVSTGGGTRPDYCDLWFLLGRDAINVSQSTHAKAIAEVIIAQAR